jgi:hypothetical protein
LIAHPPRFLRAAQIPATPQGRFFDFPPEMGPWVEGSRVEALFFRGSIFILLFFNGLAEKLIISHFF